jgi:hypothetical protein
LFCERQAISARVDTPGRRSGTRSALDDQLRSTNALQRRQSCPRAPRGKRPWCLREMAPAKLSEQKQKQGTPLPLLPRTKAVRGAYVKWHLRSLASRKKQGTPLPLPCHYQAGGYIFATVWRGYLLAPLSEHLRFPRRTVCIFSRATARIPRPLRNQGSLVAP